MKVMRDLIDDDIFDLLCNPPWVLSDQRVVALASIAAQCRISSKRVSQYFVAFMALETGPMGVCPVPLSTLNLATRRKLSWNSGRLEKARTRSLKHVANGSPIRMEFNNIKHNRPRKLGGGAKAEMGPHRVPRTLLAIAFPAFLVIILLAEA